MTDPDDGETVMPAGEAHRSSPGRVLYPVLDDEDETVVQIAAGIAHATDGELLVGHVHADGDEHSLDVDRDVAQTVFRLRSGSTVDVPVDGQTLTGASALDAVVDAVETYDVDTVVLGGQPAERLEAKLARKVDCDTLVVNDGTRPEAIASILVPVAGGPHSASAVEAAAAIAGATDAWVELLHVVAPDASETDRTEAEEMLEQCRSRSSPAVDVDARVVEGADVADTIIEESAYHDLTIIGTPQAGRLRRLIFGSTTADVRERAHGTVVMVRHGTGGETTVFSGL